MNPVFYKYGQMARAIDLAKGGESGLKGLKNIVTFGGEPGQASMIAGSLMVTALGEALIVRGYKGIAAGLGAMVFGKKEDGKEADPIWEEVLKNLGKNYPVSSPFINAYQYGSMPGAVWDAFKQLVDGMNNIGKAKTFEGKLKWAVITGIKATTLGVGVPMGMTAAKVIQHEWKLPKGAQDILDKSMDKMQKAIDWDSMLEKQIAGPK